MHTNKKTSMLGITLLELLIVMAMIAIVGSLAAPSFDSSISRNNVQSMRDSLFNAMQFARSEALKRKMPVGVCASNDQINCANDTNWHLGWVVFVDQNANGTQDGVALEASIQAHYGEGNLTTPLGTSGLVLFNRLGLANNPQTDVCFVDPKHAANTNRRGVQISAVGSVLLRSGFDGNCI